MPNGFQCPADLIADRILGNSECSGYIAIFHPVSTAHQEYSSPFGRKVSDRIPDACLFEGIVNSLVVWNRHAIFNRKNILIQVFDAHLFTMTPYRIDASVFHGGEQIGFGIIYYAVRPNLGEIGHECILDDVFNQRFILLIMQGIDTQRLVVEPEQRIYVDGLTHITAKITTDTQILKFFFLIPSGVFIREIKIFYLPLQPQKKKEVVKTS